MFALGGGVSLAVQEWNAKTERRAAVRARTDGIKGYEDNGGGTKERDVERATLLKWGLNGSLVEHVHRSKLTAV
jgi:hypothetical protein